MNIKNLKFLRDGLKYMGFGETLYNDLESNLKAQPKDFTLTFSGQFNFLKSQDDRLTVGTDRVDYTLQFRKSNENDMFFFNRYEATLRRDDSTNDVSQTFFVDKNSGVTAKEAYNLLKGRAIYKKLATRGEEPVKAWLQIDFTKKDDHGNHLINPYHSGYGYKLDDIVKRYPIKELHNEDEKNRVISSLEKGNMVPVTFQREGHDEKMFVEANPKYKTLTLYTEKLERVFQGAERNQTKDIPKSRQEVENSEKNTRSTNASLKTEDVTEQEAPARRRRAKM